MRLFLCVVVVSVVGLASAAFTGEQRSRPYIVYVGLKNIFFLSSANYLYSMYSLTKAVTSYHLTRKLIFKQLSYLLVHFTRLSSLRLTLKTAIHAGLCAAAAPIVDSYFSGLIEQITLVARSVAEKRQHNDSMTPVFFFQVVLNSSTLYEIALAKKLGATHIPFVVFLRPDSTPPPADFPTSFSPETLRLRLLTPFLPDEVYPLQQRRWDARSLLSFVKTRVGQEIPLSLPWYQNPMLNKIGFIWVVANMLFLVFYFGRNLPWRWFAAVGCFSLAVVWYSLAGGTFLWYNQVPFIAANPRTGAPMFLLPGKAELGVEGVGMASALIAFSFCIIGLQFSKPRSFASLCLTLAMLADFVFVVRIFYLKGFY